jgi:hypothetical protein
MPIILICTVLLTIVDHQPAQATHAVDHRYTVFGILYDAQGHPIPHAKIELRDPAMPDALAVTTTTAIGTYHLVAHLHDEDRGRRLVLIAGAQTIPFTVTFDPLDHIHERMHRIDIGQPAPSSLLLPLLTGAAILALAAIYYLMQRRPPTEGPPSTLQAALSDQSPQENQ